MKPIPELLSEMTLEEKASLLSGDDVWHTKAVERLGIPRVMVSDGPHGLRKEEDVPGQPGVRETIKAVCFPTACSSTASFDRDAVRRMGEALGEECQHEGVAVNLGPAINIKRSPLCGRNFEYMTEDPFLAGEMAVSLVQGIQSRDVGTSVKHFACNSQEHRRMSSDSTVDERTLREIYLPAYEAAAKRGKAWTFMCSYNRLNGEYASQNKRLLTELLRDEWGYEGLVMSDWGAVSDRVKGVPAGLDLEMPSSHGVNDAEIVRAVREGRLSEKDVDRCAERVLRLVERFTATARPDTPWDLDAHHALAAELAADCMVLLKNEGGLLPFAPGEKVAVIGEFAEKPRFQGGGSSHINCHQVTSLMDALEGMPGVTYAQGYRIDSDEADEALAAEALAAAKAADKALLVIGLPERDESEGFDRKHLRLPANQNALVEAVSRVNPNVAVLLYNGAPVEMPWVNCIRGLVEGYLAGQAVGLANKAVLWGEVNPSGRLPESFPLRLEDTPCSLSYGGEGDRAVYSEGVFVGYRYYTAKKQPVLFPFGAGGSYTTFAYSNLRLNHTEMDDTDTLRVEVDVTNTGSRPGKEVVQLYVAPHESRVFRPVRELKGFEKLSLAPGETKTAVFTLDKRAFAYWSVETHGWFVETGVFGIEICRSAEEVILSTPVTVRGTVPAPLTVTEDTIVEDLARYPAKFALLKKAVAALKNPDGAEAEAIGDNDVLDMDRYAPLRTLIAFGERMDHQRLGELIDAMNRV
ncbi:MAG: glycoside hydrolase family 3 C-terminal domain-containing protein [Clostridia bacterium]|nr:glycoside hydrolase family 3 C-terminal domain-containing protein [Clostridia bacterium]